jgi:hypothetical protein
MPGHRQGAWRIGLKLLFPTRRHPTEALNLSGTIGASAKFPELARQERRSGEELVDRLLQRFDLDRLAQVAVEIRWARLGISADGNGFDAALRSKVSQDIRSRAIRKVQVADVEVKRLLPLMCHDGPRRG